MSDDKSNSVPDAAALPDAATADTLATAHWPSLDAAEELAQLLDAYVADLKAGKTPDREQLLADHPALAV